MAMNTGTQFTDSTDGRQRLAGVMTGTNPYATGGTAGGNMSMTSAGNAGSNVTFNPWAQSTAPTGTGPASMGSLGGSNGNMATGDMTSAGNAGSNATFNPWAPVSAPTGTGPASISSIGGSNGNMSMATDPNAGSAAATNPWTAATAPTGTGPASMGTYGGSNGNMSTNGAPPGDPGTGTGNSANQPAAQAGGYNPDGSFNPDLPPVNSAAMSTANSDHRFSSVGDIGSYGGAMDPATMKAGADAAYGAASQFFDPDFQRQRSTLENQLASQGFTRGSEGYNNALDDMQRQQNLARTNAGLQAQGIGFGQANSLIQNALQTRAQDVAMRGQDRGVDAAGQSASATIGAANIGANAGNYRADLESELGLRGLGLQQDNQDYNQMMGLMGGARAGVNAPNFGQAAPLDVGSAYGVASGNANAAANRAASDRNGLYQLGGSLLGSAINGYFGN